MSGTFEIDPDGSGSDPASSVWCDMTTEGGGWTVVFLAGNSNLYSSTLQYAPGTRGALASAQTALIAYRTNQKTVTGNYASFALPDGWRTANPLSAPGTTMTVSVSVSGAAATSATLQFGYQQFVSVCGDAWNASSANGRICIAGTKAPFYASFANASMDSCADGTQSAGLVPCGADRVFSIAVK
jgi:hypothetical protein